VDDLLSGIGGRVPQGKPFIVRPDRIGVCQKKSLKNPCHPMGGFAVSRKKKKAGEGKVYTKIFGGAQKAPKRSGTLFLRFRPTEGSGGGKRGAESILQRSTWRTIELPSLKEKSGLKKESLIEIASGPSVT